MLLTPGRAFLAALTGHAFIYSIERDIKVFRTFLSKWPGFPKKISSWLPTSIFNISDRDGLPLNNLKS
jgi:hypothetical protein